MSSSRRAISVPTNFAEKPPKKRGRCVNCLCISWKIFACILSHTMLIAIVIAYCVLGAFAFSELEGPNEKQVIVCLFLPLFFLCFIDCC